MLALLQPHDPNWKTAFAAIQQLLQEALVELRIPFDIQHVGSTAIAGLVAKPVLDIDIIIKEESALPPISLRLEQLGYIARGDQGIPGRWAFRQSSAFTPGSNNQQAWPAHHLYVCLADSLAVQNHLLFRDALLANAALVKQYAQLKQSLVSAPAMTRDKYSRLKTEFILSVLASAGLDEDALQEIRAANT